MTGGLPLLVARDLDAPLAWRGGEPLSARRFIADARAQAGELPEHGTMVNLCVDRWRFGVGLAAALLRDHVSLLPPNALPDTLARLRAASPLGGIDGAAAPQMYGLCDDRGLTASDPYPAFFRRCVDAGGAAAAAAASLGEEVPLIDPARLAACLLTSGSTGTPQPHAKTWGTLVRNIEAAARRLAQILERPTLAGLNIVATVPAQHSYGFESSVLLALLGGAAFDSGRPYFPADIVRALARLPRPRALVTTPFHLKTLLLAGLTLPRVDLVLCATAPLSPQLALQAEQGFGAPLIEIYGCTEAGQVATRRTVASEVWHTFDGLRIASADAAAPDSPDAPEISHAEARRFSVQGGHVDEPTPLADVLQLESAERFRLLGRADDLIHVAGKRSSLAHLNYHLNSIAGVVDGVFWLPRDVVDGVVRPFAFVVAPDLSAAQLTAALRTRIDAVFVPRRIVFVPRLPRAATGKLTDEALRALAQPHLP